MRTRAAMARGSGARERATVRTAKPRRRQRTPSGDTRQRCLIAAHVIMSSFAAAPPVAAERLHAATQHAECCCRCRCQSDANMFIQTDIYAPRWRRKDICGRRRRAPSNRRDAGEPHAAAGTATLFYAATILMMNIRATPRSSGTAWQGWDSHPATRGSGFSSRFKGIVPHTCCEKPEPQGFHKGWVFQNQGVARYLAQSTGVCKSAVQCSAVCACSAIWRVQHVAVFACSACRAATREAIV